MKNVKNVFLTISAAIVLLLSVGACKDGAAPEAAKIAEVDPPSQIISVEQAKSMYDQYTDRRAALIQRFEDSVQPGEKKFDVARYTYYDYKTIKQYLAYIEQEAEKAGVEISTLRFYFSNYPDKGQFEDGKKIVHPRQNSIFLMPTLNSEGLDYGFFTVEAEGGAREAVLLNGELGAYSPEGMGQLGEKIDARNYAAFAPSFNSKAGATAASGYQGGNSLILNEGSSAPPPYH